MPKEFSRTRRVGEQIQRELAELIRNEVKDPRVGMVTIQAVRVTRDLGHAKVYFTVLGDQQSATDTQKALDRAAGFLRHALGQEMAMRSVPQLHFIYDESVEHGMHLSKLIEDACASDRQDGDDEDESGQS